MGTFCSRFRSRAGPNVSAAAQSGGHIIAPVLTNNTITGDVHFLHNAHGFTFDRPHSETTQTSATRSLIFKHKTRICTEYQYVTEYNSLPGERVLLSERYTQPLILQRHRDQKEREAELCSSGEDFQQVLSSRSGDESSHLNYLFNPDGHGISPSSVILQGNSGNGKTLTVQKIMMDWASDKLYKERFAIVFHLKCKEINRIAGIKSLVEVLSYSCSLTSDEISQILQQSPEKILFIIDGFDELRLTQDIYDMSPHTDVIQKAPAEVTLCALLRGHILPESFLLVATRSTATDTLSKLLKGPQRFTEIMGFSEKGVEEYFQKFFQDEELFRRAYTFVKTNENLFTTCSIPVICWIICTTIKERFRVGADVTSVLETTTSIYVDFVSTLLKHHCQGLSQSVPTLLRSLGQLAERGMLEQQVLLDEKTVYETISDPVANPFLCKFLFKRRICQETMFSFMHLSFQEFFTALYCVILDEEESPRKLAQLISVQDSGWLEHPPRFAAVVQFVFGLLNKDVRHTLRKTLGLFVHPNTQALLKEWILKELQSDIYHYRTLFILHCLYELHEEDFVIKAMKSWNRINAYGAIFRRTDCWALLYCSQCCQCIEELDLLDCRLTSEKLMMILPALPKFKKLTLSLEDPSVSDLVELMCVLTRGQTLNTQDVHVISNVGTCTVRRADLSTSEELSRICIQPPWHVDPAGSLQSLGLTFPRSELNNINWTKLFQIIHQKDSDALMLIPCSFSKLKKMEIRVDCLTKRWCVWTLQIIQNCPSLTELKVDAYFLLEEGIKILQRSRTRPACIMKVDGLVCHKQSQKCTHYKDRELSCNQKVMIHLSSQGCSMETLRKSLF
ncbi:NACHT, LRR and PYD domains-containing protein 3-like isoform X2 [Sinocyclocheilus rhinocerous]|uniref:NACHT, LRR and PYD domains-containing protein 3-like n=1 Tax=Sinocyclocheilus rhinocerous TaxID=307959 RepID=A0A673KCG8_9TELE|nr:PREDICTED: NACHT, LRR and PYD domains-containing protein 3-like isoform X2 [Sinocyclocheilus rhinocerous]